MYRVCDAQICDSIERKKKNNNETIEQKIEPVQN